jgi:transaldolase
MTDNPLVRLNRLGQSVWYDNIRRGLLQSGGLERMVRTGEVRGITSNPAIFEQAIGRTDEYDRALRSLSGGGRSAEQAYEVLALEDVRAAADILRPVFAESGGADGFVSLEVSPALAEDADTTLREAERLWRAVDRPNLMIKIPGTLACLNAVRLAIAGGINVNITLLFSVERYRKVMDAYLAGLEERAAKRLPLDGVSSVASFFVSRVDTLIDGLLEEAASADPSRKESCLGLRGRAAIANTRLAYQEFLAALQEDRFRSLLARGARIQRPLWASTSTKNPAYPDTYYVESLVARNSINTMPPVTIEAYRDHGNPSVRIDESLADARALTASLAALGISLPEATDRLEEEGILAFQRSYDSMLKVIRAKLIPSG